MARLRGFEPPTSGSGDQRSIQLSYRRVVCPSCQKKEGAIHGIKPAYASILTCPSTLRHLAFAICGGFRDTIP